MNQFPKYFSSIPFDKAVQSVKLLKSEPSDLIKLSLYALFKQSTIGKCNIPSPPMYQFVEKAKYNEWKSLEHLTQNEAKLKYVAEIEKLLGYSLSSNDNSPSGNDTSTQQADKPAAPQLKNTEPMASNVSNSTKTSLINIAFPTKNANGLKNYHGDTIKCNLINNSIAHVILSRPTRGNSFNLQMWQDYRNVFECIEHDEQVKVVILSGEGPHFSTGMDLTVFADMQSLFGSEQCSGKRNEGLGRIIEYLQSTVSLAERCRVPVLAAVHGNCIGGAVDVITACDLR